MQDCYACNDLNAKSREIRRLHTVCRAKDDVLKSLIEAGETVLARIERLGYVGGDMHDDLEHAIEAGTTTR